MSPCATSIEWLWLHSSRMRWRIQMNPEFFKNVSWILIRISGAAYRLRPVYDADKMVVFFRCLMRNFKCAHLLHTLKRCALLCTPFVWLILAVHSLKSIYCLLKKHCHFVSIRKNAGPFLFFQGFNLNSTSKGNSKYSFLYRQFSVLTPYLVLSNYNMQD